MSISDEQKRHIRERAGNCCEYCRLAEAGRLARFHIDHIIAIKHEGTDADNNLCLACPKCNAHKGDNVAALDPLTHEATKLYNPRQQKWEDHFTINLNAAISGRTPEGRTTVFVLRINDEERVKQRMGEMTLGDYPCTND